MSISAFSRYALTGCVAVAMLAGCGGSQPPIGAPGAMPQSVQSASHAASGRSWMLQQAAGGDLLYVTDPSTVTMYSYPQGHVVGTLKGFYYPGICAGNEGHIFITNDPSGRISEYAHGGHKPIAVLKPGKGVGITSCAVDPTTGDLAVTGTNPRVDIFKNARGSPHLYKDLNFFTIAGCIYDHKGNLFIGGLNVGKKPRRKPLYAELPKGGTSFINITLDDVLNPDFILQWYGKYLAIGGYVPFKGGKYTPVIYQIAIEGTKGVKVGTTTLGSPAYITHQLSIWHGTVVTPNWYYSDSALKYDVLFYNYPDGGSPTKILTKHLSFPYGAAISVAPH
jgi:hypothetical protein